MSLLLSLWAALPEPRTRSRTSQAATVLPWVRHCNHTRLGVHASLSVASLGLHRSLRGFHSCPIGCLSLILQPSDHAISHFSENSDGGTASEPPSERCATVTATTHDAYAGLDQPTCLDSAQQHPHTGTRMRSWRLQTALVFLLVVALASIPTSRAFASRVIPVSRTRHSAGSTRRRRG